MGMLLTEVAELLEEKKSCRAWILWHEHFVELGDNEAIVYIKCRIKDEYSEEAIVYNAKLIAEDRGSRRR